MGPDNDELLWPFARFFLTCSARRSPVKRECLTPSQQPCNYSNVILPERFPGLQVRVQKNRAQRANRSRVARGHDEPMTPLAAFGSTALTSGALSQRGGRFSQGRVCPP